MKSLLVIGLALAAALYNTDLESDSVWRGVVLPIVDFVLICALVFWLAGRYGWKKLGARTHGSSIGFMDGGSDGGGCD